MPVANDQIDELYDIFSHYLKRTEMREMLIELRVTEAYRRNKSFAVTIDRLFTILQAKRTK